MSPLPRIAITLGDPAGIGPEIIAGVIGDSEVNAVCELVVYGKREDNVRIGIVDAANGAQSNGWVELAIKDARKGSVRAVVTGPISKEAWAAAGIKYPGHTELFAERCGAKRTCMMLTSEIITCSVVTAHVGYRDVPGLLSVEKIVDAIELSAAALRCMRGREPRLIVCGLNPHAGEHGLFGDREEERIIVPAIEAARKMGYVVEGPLPPDTAFVPSKRAKTDGYICMYHDQGLIPLKALAFDAAVNVTLGLPFPRTSPDHGTAFDIAGTDLADPSSMKQAILLAARLIGTQP